MLSAFHARPILELKQRDKSKIESILAFGNRLLVGLNTGSLRIYRVNESADQQQLDDGLPDSESGPAQVAAVDLMRELEKFSKHKIEQLAIIKEANLLISLSNGLVSLHDVQTFELHEIFAKTKGASTFAITSNIVKDSVTGVPSIVSRLAVAVKRKLLLWSWHDMELVPDSSEMTLVTGIKSLTWATGTRILAGLTSSYVLINLETSAITDIIGPGSIGGAPGQDGGRFGGVGVAGINYMGIAGAAPKPLATRLGEGEMLLAKDINTLFINTEGSSLGRRQIPWSVAPDAVGYSYPYLIALQATKSIVELRNPETLSLLQTISLPHATQLHVTPPNVSLAHAGKGFLVISERCIWQMRALDYDSQIDALVSGDRLDEAISLIEMLEDALLKDKKGRLQELKMLKAQDLFDHHKFRASFELFTEISAPPERVIRLFPSLISGSAPSSFDDQKPESHSSQNIELRIEEKSNGNEKKTDSEPGYADTSSAKTLLKDNKIREENMLERRNGEISENRKELDEKDLKTATEELRAFLVSARTRLQRFLNPDGRLKSADSHISNGLDGILQPDSGFLLGESSSTSLTDREQQLLSTAKIIDTTLFRAYMFVSPSLVGPLFRIDNFCDPQVVKVKLIETGRYNDLVNFYYGKKLHRSALELLKKFGQGEAEDDLAPALFGPQRTVAYLQNLPSEMIELILEFAEWTIKKDAQIGMEIFLADTENAETLPRSKVLDFLQGTDRKLVVEYLEHIIQELNDTTPDFHQRLAEIYIDGLRSNNLEHRTDESSWESKALDFLRTSRYYQPYKALRQMSAEDPNLYEARAIVLSNMGQHKQALEIFVFKLQDPEKAEEYCNQVFLAESSRSTPSFHSRRLTTMDPEDGPPSIYHTLLSLYLSPPPPYKPQWVPALDVLAKHGARMPASTTLELIPEILPISDLESYFRGRIRSGTTIVNESRVISGLRSGLRFSEDARLRLGDGFPGGNKGRNRSVLITETRVCGVCHKRLGGSAIKVFPDNSVIHYGCSNR